MLEMGENMNKAPFTHQCYISFHVNLVKKKCYIEFSQRVHMSGSVCVWILLVPFLQ